MRGMMWQRAEDDIYLVTGGEAMRRPTLPEGVLICPVGTADCPEVEVLRACLLAANPADAAVRRGVRSRLPA